MDMRFCVQLHLNVFNQDHVSGLVQVRYAASCFLFQNKLTRSPLTTPDQNPKEEELEMAPGTEAASDQSVSWFPSAEERAAKQRLARQRSVPEVFEGCFKSTFPFEGGGVILKGPESFRLDNKSLRATGRAENLQVGLTPPAMRAPSPPPPITQMSEVMM